MPSRGPTLCRHHSYASEIAKTKKVLHAGAITRVELDALRAKALS
jgi:hypothetical protein